MTQTYWSNNRNPAEVDYLNAQVPAEGPVTSEVRPWLEAWRRFTNGYYDLFNNGWCNWDMVGREFQAACTKADYKFNKGDLVHRDGEFVSEGSRPWRVLELAGDAILRNAIFECARLGTYKVEAQEVFIDWAAAPEWAKFAAMDRGGQWYWHENKPWVCNSDDDPDNHDWLSSGFMKSFEAESFKGGWRNSLQHRLEE